MGGFLTGLFGGDKANTTTTTNNNTNIDASTTKTNSDNSSSWLQQNLSQIRNTVNTVNQSLQNTDSFNRTNLTMLTNVGNVAGSTSDPFLSDTGVKNLFDTVLSHPIVGFDQNALPTDVNANPYNFDFAAQNRTATDVIDASANQLGSYYRGITDLSAATSPNQPWYKSTAVVIGAVALVALLILPRLFRK